MRVCIVTGAGSGIGRGIGLRLAAEGSAVVFADIDGARADAAAAEARGRGASAMSSQVDVTNRAEVRSLVETAVREFGELNVMINNAGVSQTRPFLEITEAEWNRLMTVNGLGVLIGMQEAAKQMIEQGKRGKIINAESIAARRSYPLNAHYCASKHAVHALTTAGAQALAPYKITCNAYGPGWVNTDLLLQVAQEFVELGVAPDIDEVKSGFSAGILLGRIATPDDVADLVSFLCSPASDYLTGQLVMCDGGMLIQ